MEGIGIHRIWIFSYCIVIHLHNAWVGLGHRHFMKMPLMSITKLSIHHFTQTSRDVMSHGRECQITHERDITLHESSTVLFHVSIICLQLLTQVHARQLEVTLAMQAQKKYVAFVWHPCRKKFGWNNHMHQNTLNLCFKDYFGTLSILTITKIIWLVCLFTCSLLAETHLGPDWTSLKQNAQTRFWSLYKYAGLVVYGNNR